VQPNHWRSVARIIAQLLYDGVASLISLTHAVADNAVTVHLGFPCNIEWRRWSRARWDIGRPTTA
jgi:hypothetical protein